MTGDRCDVSAEVCRPGGHPLGTSGGTPRRDDSLDIIVGDLSFKVSDIKTKAGDEST